MTEDRCARKPEGPRALGVESLAMPLVQAVRSAALS
jgi:hypothetical protein